MHDPMTVAFEIKYPWGKRSVITARDGTQDVYYYREPFLTIWHCDPERDGSDDSCDWFNRGKAEDRADPKRQAVYEALWDMETLLDNRPHYPDSPEHLAFQPLKTAIRAALAPPPRRWWRHPRWHLHHWRVQCHPLQSLKRWLFSRCARCGKGFRWGYAPVLNSWDSDGPRWFRGEPGVYHHECTGHLPSANRPAGAVSTEE